MKKLIGATILICSGVSLLAQPASYGRDLRPLLKESGAVNSAPSSAVVAAPAAPKVASVLLVSTAVPAASTLLSTASGHISPIVISPIIISPIIITPVTKPILISPAPTPTTPTPFPTTPIPFPTTPISPP
jgi:hypothetical protein